MFSLEEKSIAVKQLIEFDLQYTKTIRSFGYPCSTVLNQRINEMAPNEKRICASGENPIRYSREVKEASVLALCTRTTSADSLKNMIYRSENIVR